MRSRDVSIYSIDLNLLAVLHAVLVEGSVARAARRLHVTPSAVSNAIARLRELLDDPLFVRRGRGIAFTQRALELAPKLERALGEIEALVRGPDFDPGKTTRVFTLAAADAGQVAYAPRLVASFSARMPRAELRIVGIDSLISSGGLSGDEVDVAVGPGKEGPGIHLKRLFDEEAILVGRRGHPLAGLRLSRSRLPELRHVAVSMSVGGRGQDLTQEAYLAKGIARKVVVTVPTFVAAAKIAAASDLVATIPRSLYLASGRALGVVPLALPQPVPAIEIRMAWHDRTHADPAMLLFRELVREAWRPEALSS